MRDVRLPRTLKELTDRTLALADALLLSPPELALPAPPTGNVSLADLPGTIELLPLNGVSIALWTSRKLFWANGELPDDVKRAGGASWKWHTGKNTGPLYLTALAQNGARLFVDDVLLIDCPPGLPVMPAPHRCPRGSQTRFVPTKAVHSVRLELASQDPTQAASVLLCGSNFHLLPWSGETLPFAPILE